MTISLPSASKAAPAAGTSDAGDATEEDLGKQNFLLLLPMRQPLGNLRKRVP